MVPPRAQWPSSAPKARGGRVSAPTRVGPAWAAREGRTGRTRISDSSLVRFPAFSWPHEGDTPWPHHLKHPPPKFLDWGEGWAGAARTLLTAFFWNIFRIFGGERGHSQVLRKEVEGK